METNNFNRERNGRNQILELMKINVCEDRPPPSPILPLLEQYFMQCIFTRYCALPPNLSMYHLQELATPMATTRIYRARQHIIVISDQSTAFCPAVIVFLASSNRTEVARTACGVLKRAATAAATLENTP